MDPNKKHVSELNIKDLCFACLKKIWIMLIAGAILGGALFTYYVIQVKKTSDTLDITKKLSTSETDAQYEQRVLKIQRAWVYSEMIDNTNLQIEYEKDYIANSLYMKIDPNNVYQSTAQLTLTLKNNDTNGLDKAIFSAYEREIKYGNTWDEYAEQIGTRPDYIKELISFSTSAAGDSFISVDNVPDKIGSIFINVTGPSQEFVDEVMDHIIVRVNEVYVDVNSSVAPHSISLVGIQRLIKMDNGIRDTQLGHTSRIQSLLANISSYNESIGSLAKDLGVSKNALLNLVMNHDFTEVDGIPTEVSEKELSRKDNIKPNLKYIGIGFAAGALIVAFVVVLFYIFSRKVKTQAQFFGVFVSVRKIGVMKPIYKRSKYSAFIDVKAEDDSKQSKENINKLISANYSNLTKNCNKVLITGTGDAKVMEEAVKALGIKGDFKPDIFSNPDVLKAVPDYDGVVLLEQRKVSLYKNVTNEIDLISNGGTEILGAIII